jgi:NurA-like 5'-3' nuclease
MHRETFIAKLTEVQQNVEELLTQLRASEHDGFAVHLYRAKNGIRVSLRSRRQRRQADRAMCHLDVSGRRA